MDEAELKEVSQARRARRRRAKQNAKKAKSSEAVRNQKQMERKNAFKLGQISVHKDEDNDKDEEVTPRTSKTSGKKSKKKKQKDKSCKSLRQPTTEPINIQIQKISCREVTLHWNKPTLKSGFGGILKLYLQVHNSTWEYQVLIENVTKNTSFVFYQYNTTNLNISNLTPGNAYMVNVFARNLSIDLPIALAKGTISHTPVLTIKELRELLKRAVEFVQNATVIRTGIMYRNKPHRHFLDIIENRNGIMEVYDKDRSGDPGSPINGQIQGLFFSTRVNAKTGAPPPYSPFGNVRLTLKPSRLLDHVKNLYFADFYCHKKQHYVTLVVTQKGSATDRYCAKKLIKLSFETKTPDNPFFFHKGDTDQFYCCKKVTVEVLYTENIDIKQELLFNNRCITTVPIIGRGTSRPDSKPKNPQCRVCNLYTEGLSL